MSTEAIVVMGVSGSGKTTVARMLAQTLGWEFAEGDEFHSPANVAKMRRGEPLTDEDRWPWLQAIAAHLRARQQAGASVVVTCSALRRAYRDVLRDVGYPVRFLHVAPSAEQTGERIRAREGHYMPPSLLPSQLATLEPLQPDEPGAVLRAQGDPEQVLQDALQALELPAETG